MSSPAPGGGTTTRWRALVLAAAAVVVLAGCDLATGTVRTATELQEAGVRNPNLQYDGGEATVEYDSGANPFGLRAEQDRAAEVIWRNLPFRIDRITVSVRDGFSRPRTYPRALLERQFGPRPAGLDRSPSELARRAVLIAGVVALVVLAAVVLIIVLVVRAVRRRQPAQPAGPWPQAQGQQPWGQPVQGQQPWGQPGYGPPPGQGWPQQPGPPAGGGGDWPAGAPDPGPAGPPSRGPGDTQRLDPGPPPQGEPPQEDRGPTPPS